MGERSEIARRADRAFRRNRGRDVVIDGEQGIGELRPGA